MDLIGAKVIVLILLGLVKLFSGLGPLLLVKFVKKEGMKWMEHFMAGLMCFGGGVLLATVFIHMLPEVRESLETSRRDNGVDPQTIQGSYPFGELVSILHFAVCRRLMLDPIKIRMKR
jgi:zinc transporter 1/2/3